jgi:hypothetical protein
MNTRTATGTALNERNLAIRARISAITRGILTFRWWYWAGVPLLALAAYAPVLRIGFVSDDLVLMYQAASSGIDPTIFVPQPHWYLYRPLGTMLVWQVGWQLWGFNPLPYHLQGLLLHAGVSLLIGLWLAAVTDRRSLGWVAGALFAVFPLHLEVVGWVAAQWDALAAFFGVLSLYLYTVWWKKMNADPSRGSSDRVKTGHRYASLALYIPHILYVLSILLYTAAIFTKESLLLFLPMFPIAAWLATPRDLSTYIPYRRRWHVWQRCAVSLIPFCTALALNAALRLFYWGHLGGYGRTQTDHGALLSAFWEQLITFSRMLLSPINSTILGKVTVQLVGAFITLGILIGLIKYGRRISRLLLVAAVWIVLGLAPVLNLPIGLEDLQQNRLFYLAAAGYCMGVAVLLHSAVATTRLAAVGSRIRGMALGGVALLLLVSAAVCWVQGAVGTLAHSECSSGNS